MALKTRRIQEGRKGTGEFKRGERLFNKTTGIWGTILSDCPLVKSEQRINVVWDNDKTRRGEYLAVDENLTQDGEDLGREVQKIWTQVTVNSFVPAGFIDSGWNEEDIYFNTREIQPEDLTKLGRKLMPGEVTQMKILSGKRCYPPMALSFADTLLDEKGNWVE